MLKHRLLAFFAIATFAGVCAAATDPVTQQYDAESDPRAPGDSTESSAFEVTLESQPEVKWDGKKAFTLQAPSRTIIELSQRSAGGASWVHGHLAAYAPPKPGASFTVHTIKLLPQPASEGPPTAVPIPLHPVGAKPEVQNMVNRTGDTKSKEYVLYGKGDIVEFGCEIRANEYCVAKDGNGKALFKVRRVL